MKGAHMGWDFGWTSRDELVAEVTSHFAPGYRLVDNRLVRQCHLGGGVEGPRGRMGVLWLLVRRGGQWGYRAMDWDEGPYYWDCPLEYLDMAGEPGTEYGRRWRDEVYRRRGLVVGQPGIFA